MMKPTLNKKTQTKRFPFGGMYIMGSGMLPLRSWLLIREKTKKMQKNQTSTIDAELKSPGCKTIDVPRVYGAAEWAAAI
jgi:hypothetical protein